MECWVHTAQVPVYLQGQSVSLHINIIFSFLFHMYLLHSTFLNTSLIYKFQLFIRCIQSTYGTPPGSLRIEIEKGNEHRIATDLPPLITDFNIRAVKLDGNAVSTVETYEVKLLLISD